MSVFSQAPVAHAHILATQEAVIKGIVVPSHPGQNSSARPYLKKPFTKIGLVEWLKVKALSSSPNTTKTKTKKPVQTFFCDACFRCHI
jgi:hypothetical protein